MQFQFIASSKLTLEHKQGEPTSRHVRTDIILDISKGMDKSVYFDKEGLPTKAASKPMTQALVQGLVANIHQSHEKGFWDSAEHLRYIIAELEKGFAAVAKVSTGKF